MAARYVPTAPSNSARTVRAFMARAADAVSAVALLPNLAAAAMRSVPYGGSLTNLPGAAGHDLGGSAVGVAVLVLPLVIELTEGCGSCGGRAKRLA